MLPRGTSDYNGRVIIHFDSSLPGAWPLLEAQSRSLLNFCRRVGATTFNFNFLIVKGEVSEKAADDCYERFHRFSLGKRVLENIYGQGFGEKECWALNDESVEAILTETSGNLLAYNILHLPEDWLFYLGDEILLQIVSHEQEASLRLSDAQYFEFKKLGIPHKQGVAKWSVLPVSPFRTSGA